MRKAFTLIEFLVYMGLMSLFLIVLTNILATSLETLTESNQVTTIDSDSRYILARMAYDIGRAADITTALGLYTVVSGNLMLGPDRLNSFDSTIGNFVVTGIGKTVKINFDITLGTRTRSLFTTLGLR